MGKTFLLAPDSFKECMTAKQVCEAIEVGVRRALPDACFIHVPMADGGEGTVQSLVDATQGKLYNKIVVGPLGEPVHAQYGVLGDGKTAVIEMASASGIQYVTEQSKNPIVATTYGTGELIVACLDRGITNIIVGIGGSATNDGGSGMATALGYRLLDKNGEPLPLGGGYLDRLATIDSSHAHPLLKQASIVIASDVTNPLCGELGASAVFGPQKGATPEMVKKLDENLKHYAAIIKRELGQDIASVQGTGAAGGLGAGLLAFTNATMQRGVGIIITYTGLETLMEQADYCITGEGGIDYQTQFGKTPYGVAQVAKRVNKAIKVIALAGNVGTKYEKLYEHGFDAIFGIAHGASDLEGLKQRAADNITRTAESIARLLV